MLQVFWLLLTGLFFVHAPLDKAKKCIKKISCWCWLPCNGFTGDPESSWDQVRKCDASLPMAVMNWWWSLPCKPIFHATQNNQVFYLPAIITHFHFLFLLGFVCFCQDGVGHFKKNQPKLEMREQAPSSALLPFLSCFSCVNFICCWHMPTVPGNVVAAQEARVL